jgi:hypothetical protein
VGPSLLAMCSHGPTTTRGPEGDTGYKARRALCPVTSLPQSPLCRQFATAATMMRPISAAMQMKPMTDATLTVLCVLLIPSPIARSGVAVSGFRASQTSGPRGPPRRPVSRPSCRCPCVECPRQEDA